jgi:glycosyltransferase involved in cell wall biosynthesis
VFQQPVHPAITDYPGRMLEVTLARARRRVPPPPVWLRRSAAAWQIDGPGAGPVLGTSRPRPLIYAITAVWNEEDIVYALVEHLCAQGVDRVFVIDDESDDATVAEATAAGAEVIRTRSDGTYSEAVRSARVRDAIATYTEAAGGDVWWLVVDADEFPRGPDGTTVRDLVERAPGWVDVVGSRVLDHVPAGADDYLPRQPPLPFFPLARWFRSAFCGRGHWKHPLIRVRQAGDVYPMPGHHTVGTVDGRRAREWVPTLLTHHFPLRAHRRTEEKLRRAMTPDGRYATSPDGFTRDRILERLRALDDLYAGRYERVASGFAGDRRMGITVSDWRALVSPLERATAYGGAPVAHQAGSSGSSHA